MPNCPAYFNIFGLILDLVGVLFLVVYGKKTLGITAGFEEVFIGARPWYHAGISCLIIGFILQIIGNILSIQ
jgi:hypothetical protein